MQDLNDPEILPDVARPYYSANIQTPTDLGIPFDMQSPAYLPLIPGKSVRFATFYDSGDKLSHFYKNFHASLYNQRGAEMPVFSFILDGLLVRDIKNNYGTSGITEENWNYFLLFTLRKFDRIICYLHNEYSEDELQGRLISQILPLKSQEISLNPPLQPENKNAVSDFYYSLYNRQIRGKGPCDFEKYPGSLKDIKKKMSKLEKTLYFAKLKREQMLDGIYNTLLAILTEDVVIRYDQGNIVYAFTASAIRNLYTFSTAHVYNTSTIDENATETVMRYNKKVGELQRDMLSEDDVVIRTTECYYSWDFGESEIGIDGTLIIREGSYPGFVKKMVIEQQTAFNVLR